MLPVDGGVVQDAPGDLEVRGVLEGDLLDGVAVECENLRVRPPPETGRRHSAARASMIVDLPVPFSPTKKVTGEANSISRPRTMGRLNGYSSDRTACSFRCTRTRYGGVDAIGQS